jgi:hypothetical protein
LGVAGKRNIASFITNTGVCTQYLHGAAHEMWVSINFDSLLTIVVPADIVASDIVEEELLSISSVAEVYSAKYLQTDVVVKKFTAHPTVAKGLVKQMTFFR